MKSAAWVLTLCVLAATACTHKGSQKNPQVFGEAAMINKEAKDITKEDELENRPGKFVGHDVKLRGEVKEVVGASAFKMPIDDFMGQDEILVINQTGYKVPIKRNDYVEVKGPLRLFTVAEVAEIVDKDIVDALYVEYGNQPVIVAEVVKGYWAENRPTQKTRVARDIRDRDSDDRMSH